MTHPLASQVQKNVNGFTDEQILEDREALKEIRNPKNLLLWPESLRGLIEKRNKEYLELWAPIIEAELERRGLKS